MSVSSSGSRRYFIPKKFAGNTSETRDVLKEIIKTPISQEKFTVNSKEFFKPVIVYKTENTDKDKLKNLDPNSTDLTALLTRKAGKSDLLTGIMGNSEDMTDPVSVVLAAASVKYANESKKNTYLAVVAHKIACWKAQNNQEERMHLVVKLLTVAMLQSQLSAGTEKAAVDQDNLKDEVIGMCRTIFSGGSSKSVDGGSADSANPISLAWNYNKNSSNIESSINDTISVLLKGGAATQTKNHFGGRSFGIDALALKFIKCDDAAAASMAAPGAPPVVEKTEGLRAEIRNLEVRLAAFPGDDTAKETEMAALRAQLADLEQRLREMNEADEAEQARLIAEIEAVKADLEAATRAKDVADAAKQVLEQQLEQLRRELESTRLDEERITGVEQRNEQLDKELADLQRKLAAAKAELQRLKESNRCVPSNFSDCDTEDDVHSEGSCYSNSASSVAGGTDDGMDRNYSCSSRAAQALVCELVSDVDETVDNPEGNKEGLIWQSSRRLRVSSSSDLGVRYSDSESSDHDDILDQSSEAMPSSASNLSNRSNQSNRLRVNKSDNARKLALSESKVAKLKLKIKLLKVNHQIKGLYTKLHGVAEQLEEDGQRIMETFNDLQLPKGFGKLRNEGVFELNLEEDILDYKNAEKDLEEFNEKFIGKGCEVKESLNKKLDEGIQICNQSIDEYRNNKIDKDLQKLKEIKEFEKILNIYIYQKEILNSIPI
jgi:hypothetical protein